jgi:hypothetical protein
MRVTELLPGARNCVKGLANIQPGDNVLILVDNTDFADPLVVEAMAIASREAGADVVCAISREFEPRVEQPPEIIKHAYLGASAVFHITPHEATIHAKAARIGILEYGMKAIPIIANTEALMASEWARFPIDLYWAIMRKVHNQIQAGKSIRVTSPGGTDISAGVNAAHGMGFFKQITGIPGPLDQGDGGFCMFPTGVYGFHPLPPAEGIIVYDALLGFKGILKEPVKLTIEDQWITKIEGGEEATWLQNLITEMKSKGVDDADYFSEIMWGVNPKASIVDGLQMIDAREGQLTRRAGTLHFGIGKGGRGFHWDGILVKPFTVLIDGEPLIKDGRLVALNDPDIRELAKEFGDPDKILSEKP